MADFEHLAAAEAGARANRAVVKLVEVVCIGVSVLVKGVADLSEHQAVPFVSTAGCIVRVIVEHAEAVGDNDEHVLEAGRRAQAVGIVITTLAHADFPIEHAIYVQILEVLAQVNDPARA